MAAINQIEITIRNLREQRGYLDGAITSLESMVRVGVQSTALAETPATPQRQVKRRGRPAGWRKNAVTATSAPAAPITGQTTGQQTTVKRRGRPAKPKAMAAGGEAQTMGSTQ